MNLKKCSSYCHYWEATMKNQSTFMWIMLGFSIIRENYRPERDEL